MQLLRKSDQKGVMAAKQTDLILKTMRDNGGNIPLSVSLKRTKNGERRITKCEKYDLGSGYRLITLRDGASLYVTFIGTHDECDLWFKKRRALDHKDASISYVESISSQEASASEPDIISSDESEDGYEKELFSRIDHETLKTVFSGLYQEVKGR